MEYEEILARHIGRQAAIVILELILDSPNTELVTNYYHWNLIYTDPDDNKFVDCAIAANAKFIVSEDQHFRVLKQIPYPKVEVRTIEEFRLELEL
jgi:predicted nucleic acid-binding protein